MLKNVEKCVEVLRAGGLILYPTDTVWGIGCDATNEEAVAKVYALKRSEEKTSMLCLMRDADMIVVMEEGRIAGVGDHETLMRENEEYQEIYYSQRDKEVDC
mgnify:CR=1 FL=1